MPDYGHDLVFGTSLTPTAADADRVLALAELTEKVGLDLVTIQDHPYQGRFLDTWTLLSVVAARTSTVTVAPNVANLPLRPPAVLAKSVATLDILSGGRVELGLGAGAFWDAITAYGGSRLSAPESVTALAEAIAVIRAVWAAGGPAVRIDGAHYTVHGAHPGPAPVHDIGIWVGAIRKRMLALTGRLGDGWLPSSAYVPPEQLAASNRVIDDAAAGAGRAPGDIRRLYNIGGTFTAGGTGFLNGPARVWAEQLAELTLTDGVSTFIVVGDDPDTVSRFAAEVAPAVRELVAAARSTGGAPGGARSASPVTVIGDTGTGGGGTGGGGTDGTGTDGTGNDGPERGTSAAAAAGSAPAPGSVPGATPTQPPATRLSARAPWDESTRPAAPAPAPGLTYTAEQTAQGRLLIDVHDYLRNELTEIRGLVDAVATGAVEPGGARAHLQAMTMRQNNWSVGAYCESYCRTVTIHHQLEDRSMFPHLRRAQTSLGPVIDRLEVEHRVIATLLDGVDAALVRFVREPAEAELHTAVDLLTDGLLSHLAYEERQLVEPLARLGSGEH